jgi:A/G-specific adenine glycosylase
LQSLPGVGQSTAGAILALAFETRATILDGNVKRVLARFYGIHEPVNEKTGEEMLWEFADKLTPTQRIADYTQAMMDMGATLCTRSKPNCESCPFKSDCIAYQKNLSAILPVKKAAKPLPVKSATFLFIQQEEQIYLEKRPDKGIWGGLWSVPEISGEPNQAGIKALCNTELGFKKINMQLLPSFRHTFTHYHLEIHPVLIDVRDKRSKHLEPRQQIWYNLHHPTSVGLPKPIQTILRALS